MTNTAALIRDLDALVAPGRAGTTIADTQRPTSAPASAPKGWEPGVKYDADGLGMTVTTTAQTVDVQRDETAWHGLVEELGMAIPAGFIVRLDEAKYDPAAWKRDTEFTEWPDADARQAKGESRYTKTPATREAVWRYKFKIEHSTRQVHVEDVAAIIAEAMRKRRKRPAAPAATETPRALNVVFADPQAGKVALLGGTQALAERVATSFDLLDDHLRDLKKVGRLPTTAGWWDGGDCIENFNNVKAQERTNDLQLTQQIRAHRRFTYHGLDYLAGKFSGVNAYTAGSNHAQVRVGTDPAGPPSDDWGIDVLSSVQDGYAHNPDAFGHVRFGYPHEWRDSLCDLSGGLPIGLAHGHQFKNGSDKGVRDWWAGQTFGEQPTAAARVLISGHFHHFAAKEMGNGRLWIQAPTLDNGSDWFTRIAGEVSVPGLLVFSSTPDGWDDLRILRPKG
jgi:hypothetical protein